MVNDYILHNTISKTLKVNKQLTKPDKEHESDFNKKHLYDLTLLEQFNIDADLLQKLKNDCMQVANKINPFTVITTTTDFANSFEYIIGNVWFKPIMVYNREGKLLYTIMKLVKCELYHKYRKSLYNSFDIISTYQDQISINYQTEYKTIA